MVGFYVGPVIRLIQRDRYKIEAVFKIVHDLDVLLLYVQLLGCIIHEGSSSSSFKIFVKWFNC